jgi:hydrogenase maturation protease
LLDAFSEVDPGANVIVTVQRSKLFVGVGSPHGDDQIGWHVADALSKVERLTNRVTIRKAGVPLDLVDWLEGVEFLGLCDAAESSSPVGSLMRWEWDDGQYGSLSELLPTLLRFRSQSSHDFDLPNVLDLAARLHRLPPRIVVWTISAKQFEPGSAISKSLQTRIAALRDQIVAELCHA